MKRVTFFSKKINIFSQAIENYGIFELRFLVISSEVEKSHIDI